jgi:simple sugar transport system substrate-binding protein
MRFRTTLLAGTAVLALTTGLAHGQSAPPPPGEGMTIYMQMGGNPGDGATLARQTGAAAAAEALGIESLNPQFSAWQPERMIEQFKQALAARPDCIVIMGHPGAEAFDELVDQAFAQGIIVTHGNSPLTPLMEEHGAKGFGYSGVDLYAGGKLTAEEMIRAGDLKTGDEAMVYGVFSQAERGQSEKGLADTLEAAGLTVDRLEVSPEANADASLAVPVLSAYVQNNPNLKAIGTQHGGITSVLADVLQKAGKRPGEIVVGGIDLAPATIGGLQSGYINVTLDQLLYLQGFIPVLQCTLSAKYKMPGLNLNTGAGVVSSETIGELVELIDEGIR